jgi:hypothetical protein
LIGAIDEKINDCSSRCWQDNISSTRSSQGKDRKILITTFTDENVREIKKKFIDINGFIPHTIFI